MERGLCGLEGKRVPLPMLIRAVFLLSGIFKDPGYARYLCDNRFRWQICLLKTPFKPGNPVRMLSSFQPMDIPPFYWFISPQGRLNVV
jgi:hypothetical protein